MKESSLWNLNRNQSFTDSVLEEEVWVFTQRNSDSPSNIVTNLEDRFPFQNDLSHSLHGYIKTVNSKNVTLEARYFDSRSGESLFTALFKIQLMEILIGENTGMKFQKLKMLNL